MARPLVLGHRAIRGERGAWERGDPVLLDADALVRHAFVCGASGFGKTVFCKGLVEEAVLAGIPVIAVDFKGDLASLALNGPLVESDALSDVFGDEGPAVRAEFVDGGADHGADPDRAAAYAERAHVRLFTPNSSLGQRVALSALPSFPDPPQSPIEREERDELIQALVHGFALTMYGTPAVLKKNEPAVKLVEELVRWCADRGEVLDGAAGIARILELVAQPPFESMGGMAIADYLPERDKKRLMQKLNSRLIGAERLRYEGRRLTVETLLDRVPEGRVPLSVVYLGHVADFTEQAAVLGQLCADIYRWMRRTGGSSGVRLLVYVDELGGGDAKQAFYPSAPHNPPSKAPLNLLVRQARSAGVAMLLATQNPMSVDVRGLGNINTWAVGRLTRRNDHARIEDLLSRLPEGPQEGAQAVSQLPPGVVLAASDGLPDGPTYLKERWLYSVHRQLAPASVGAISALLTERDRALGLAPLPVAGAASPPPSSDEEDAEDGPASPDPDAGADGEAEADGEPPDPEPDAEADWDLVDPTDPRPTRLRLGTARTEPPATAPVPAVAQDEATSRGPRAPGAGRRSASRKPGRGARSRTRLEPDAPTLSEPAPEPAGAPGPTDETPRDRRRRRRARKADPAPARAAAPEPDREPVRDAAPRSGGRRPVDEEVENTDALLADSGTHWVATPPPAPDRARGGPTRVASRGPARNVPVRGADDTDDTDELDDTDALLAVTGETPARRDDEDHDLAQDTEIEPTGAHTTHRFAEPAVDPDGPTHLAGTVGEAVLEGSRPVRVRFARAPRRPAEATTGRAAVPEPPEPDETTDRVPTARATPVRLHSPPATGEDPHERDTLTLRTAAAPTWVLRAGRRSWPVPPGAGLRIGRSSRADAQLDDPHVSRIQVELVRDGTHLVVRPLGSKNPTLLDGAPLERERRLEPGAAPRKLRVGRTELVVACEGWPPPVSGASDPA